MPCRPTSKNFPIPNCRANSRAVTPAFASATVGAGTAWSMMIAVRPGSAIFTGSGQFVNIRSISTFMSTRHTTVSPALTRSRPDARARIFSIMVMPMGIPFLSLVSLVQLGPFAQAHEAEDAARTDHLPGGPPAQAGQRCRHGRPHRAEQHTGVDRELEPEALQ